MPVSCAEPAARAHPYSPAETRGGLPPPLGGKSGDIGSTGRRFSRGCPPERPRHERSPALLRAAPWPASSPGDNSVPTLRTRDYHWPGQRGGAPATPSAAPQQGAPARHTSHTGTSVCQYLYVVTQVCRRSTHSSPFLLTTPSLFSPSPHFFYSSPTPTPLSLLGKKKRGTHEANILKHARHRTRTSMTCRALRCPTSLSSNSGRLIGSGLVMGGDSP